MSKELSKNHPQFTDEQRAAIDAHKGIICLSAGPGCGKTSVLVERYCALVQTCVEQGMHINDALSAILAVTFTNKAASEMQTRVKQRLALLTHASPFELETLMQNTHISTIDSLATSFLRDYALEMHIDPAFAVIDDARAKIEYIRLTHTYFDTFNIEETELALSLTACIEKTFTFIKHLKSRLISPAQFLKLSTASQHQKAAQMIHDLYAAYEAWLMNSNQCDFSSLLMRMHATLCARPDILRHYTRTLRYILVDEYQDINDAQDTVLRMLSKAMEKEQYFLVGDIGQSIYGFRNANYNNMMQYTRTADVSLKLRTNFRSTQTIVNFTNTFFADTRSLYQRLLPHEHASDGQHVECVCAHTPHEEAMLIAARIRKLLDEEGYAPRDIKILFRSLRTTIWTYAEALNKAHIPFVVLGASAFEQRPEVRDFLALLTIIAHPYDDISLIRALQSPAFGLSTDELIVLRNEHTREPVFDTIRFVNQRNDISEHIKQQCAACCMYIETFSERARTTPLVLLFDAVRQYTSYDAYIRTYNETDYARHIDSIETLSSLLHAYEHEHVFASLDDFLEYFKRLGEQGFWGSATSSTLDVHNIMDVGLMTVHQAKGLEFPVVIVAGCAPPIPRFESFYFDDTKGLIVNNGTHNKKDSDFLAYLKPRVIEETQQEEERIFYVATTRAQKHLIISGYENKREQVSPYILRIAQKLDETWTIRDEFSQYATMVDTHPLLEKAATYNKPVTSTKNEMEHGLPTILYQRDAIAQREGKNTQQIFFHSVSSLEAYHHCPYLYYLKHILRMPCPPKTSATDDDTLEPTARGNLVHKFFELYFRITFDVPSSTPIRVQQRDNISRANDAFSEKPKTYWAALFRTLAYQMGTPWNDELAQLFDTLFSSVHHELLHKKPAAVEYNIAWKIGTHFVRGTIDRIDRRDDGSLAIMDYKTGMKPNAQRYTLAMDIYAAALEEIEGVCVSEVLLVYPCITPLHHVSITRNAATKNVVQEILNGIQRDSEKGVFEKKDRCAWCSYKTICKLV